MFFINLKKAWWSLFVRCVLALSVYFCCNFGLGGIYFSLSHRGHRSSVVCTVLFMFTQWIHKYSTLHCFRWFLVCWKIFNSSMFVLTLNMKYEKLSYFLDDILPKRCPPCNINFQNADRESVWVLFWGVSRLNM
jgi:hypothetical protein